MTSTVRFTNSTRSSVTYWVAVDGYNGETGVARIIRPEAAWPPTSRPTNDLFAKGIVLSLLDTLAMAILVTSSAPFRKLPLAGVFVFYLLAAMLSVAVSTLP